jgi:GNAT superfamily N-acetyltransferase
MMDKMTNIDSLDTVVCRPALAKDTDEVLELCSHIWDGGDYIPRVWDEWLADPNGLVGVAESSGWVVGVFKLTKFQEREWYMEGLRVHPDFQDKGIATHIHEYVVETWRRMGSGIIRLTTGSYNVKIHHLCEQTGFKRIAEFIPYRASSLQEETNNFTVLKIEEAAHAMEFVLSSQTHALSSGLINLGWVYADPQIKHIQEVVQYRHAWWWRDGLGFISIWEDDEDEDHQPGIELLACRMSDLPELLVDYRRLMDKTGYKSAGWTAPNQPEILSLMEKAGFQRSWDVSLYIFELKSSDG